MQNADGGWGDNVGIGREEKSNFVILKNNLRKKINENGSRRIFLITDTRQRSWKIKVINCNNTVGFHNKPESIICKKDKNIKKYGNYNGHKEQYLHSTDIIQHKQLVKCQVISNLCIFGLTNVHRQ